MYLARRAALALVIGFPVAMLVTAILVLAGEAIGWIEVTSTRELDEVDFIFQVGPLSFVVALFAGAAACCRWCRRNRRRWWGFHLGDDGAGGRIRRRRRHGRGLGCGRQVGHAARDQPCRDRAGRGAGVVVASGCPIDGFAGTVPHFFRVAWISASCGVVVRDAGVCTL